MLEEGIVIYSLIDYPLLAEIYKDQAVTVRQVLRNGLFLCESDCGQIWTSSVNYFYVKSSCCTDPVAVSLWNPQTNQFECTRCRKPYEYKSRFFGIDPNDLQKARTGCDHDFTPYQGLNETFEYCKKCDQKRGDT
jgi:hypothetical protein